MVKRVLLVTGAVLGAALLVVGLLLLTPWFDGDLSSSARPTSTYAEAADALEELRALDGDQIAPECRTNAITQGRRTDEAVVLLHGFTSCPAQFAVVAQAYADAGYNVVVPRLPAHGFADRLTDGPSAVTPQMLTDSVDRAVDIASGLGERVTVVGLSAGGTMAAWAAAHRDDVDEAVVVAPLMLPKVLPEPVLAPFARAAARVPDLYLWWDGDRKEQLATPPYAYPRYSIRSLGAFLAVGRDAQGEIDRETPLDRIVVVVNEADGAVSNVPTDDFEARIAGSATQAGLVVVSADRGWKHDLITPDGENAEVIDDIYAYLSEILGLPALVEEVRSSG